MAGYIEVRRSEPAEHVDGVPDKATVWACWTDQPDSVTIYEHDGAYWVVKHEGEAHVEVSDYDDEDEAQNRAEELREGTGE